MKASRLLIGTLIITPVAITVLYQVIKEPRHNNPHKTISVNVIRNGDQIAYVTLTNGGKVIIGGNNVITLSPSTEIEQISDNHFNILKGSAYFDINNTENESINYKVETKFGAITTTGTIFRVTLISNPASVIIETIEGSVEFSSNQFKTPVLFEEILICDTDSIIFKGHQKELIALLFALKTSGYEVSNIDEALKELAMAKTARNNPLISGESGSDGSNLASGELSKEQESDLKRSILSKDILDSTQIDVNEAFLKKLLENDWGTFMENIDKFTTMQIDLGNPADWEKMYKEFDMVNATKTESLLRQIEKKTNLPLTSFAVFMTMQQLTNKSGLSMSHIPFISRKSKQILEDLSNSTKYQLKIENFLDHHDINEAYLADLQQSGVDVSEIRTFLNKPRLVYRGSEIIRSSISKYLDKELNLSDQQNNDLDHYIEDFVNDIASSTSMRDELEAKVRLARSLRDSGHLTSPQKETLTEMDFNIW